MPKSKGQLDTEITEALAKRSKRKRPEIVKLFASLADDAAMDGAENLSLAKRAEGYTGDPMEFRYSSIFAKRFPAYKYERLIDYIDEYSKSAHERLGRKLTPSEADWMRDEASKILDVERQIIASLGLKDKQ